MFSLLPLLVVLTSGFQTTTSTLTGAPPEKTDPPPGFGHGYSKDDVSLEVLFGRAFGTTDTGSNFSHDLWLTQIEGGLILADVMEPDYWFGGNIEAVGKLLVGNQDNPDGAYFFGLNAGLKYHFRTGTPFAPFLGGSFGVAVTDIGSPDATGKFQFNEQVGAGTKYFLTKQHALVLEYDYWHISNGGIREPNDGVNAHIISLGFAWLF
jgi:hypothetical protein